MDKMLKIFSTAKGNRAMNCLLVLIAAIFILSISGSKATAGAAPDSPVVKVNGKVLTEEHLSEVMNEIVPAASFHGGLSDKTMKKYRPEAIKSLVDGELMYQRAEELSLKVKRREIKSVLNSTILRLGGKRQFKAALKQHGLSKREFKKRIKRTLLIKKFQKELIEDKAAVEEGEVLGYYEENKGNYLRPEARRVSHIFIKVKAVPTNEELEARKKRAEKVLQKLHDGEDFSTLAWDYSDGPFRVKGGDMGLVHKGRLDPKLDVEVEKLANGELSGLIRTIYGFHIVRVEEVIPEEQLSFEDVGAGIKKSLGDMRLQEVTDKIISELRDNAEIEVLAE